MKKINKSRKLWYIIADDDGLVFASNGKRSKALAKLVVGKTVMMTYQALVEGVKPVFDNIRRTAEYDPELALYELDEASAQGFVRMVAIHTGDAFRDAVVNQIKQSMELAMAYGEN